MVTITDYQLFKSKDEKEFFALILQSGIEIVKSQNGNMYATAKRCALPSTFTEQVCQSLIGTELPGSILKVECEPYSYFLPENGAEITRSHRYEYVPEPTEFKVKSNPPSQKLNGQLQTT
jgi:hypothetical protein